MTAKKELFGELIKRLRNARVDKNGSAMSLRTLAEMIEVSPTYLSKIERDLNPASPAVIERLATALDISKDQLYAHADKIAPDIEEGFAQSQEPERLASFMRRANALPPDKLKLAEKLLAALDDHEK